MKSASSLGNRVVNCDLKKHQTVSDDIKNLQYSEFRETSCPRVAVAVKLKEESII